MVPLMTALVAATAAVLVIFSVQYFYIMNNIYPQFSHLLIALTNNYLGLLTIGANALLLAGVFAYVCIRIFVGSLFSDEWDDVHHLFKYHITETILCIVLSRSSSSYVFLIHAAVVLLLKTIITIIRVKVQNIGRDMSQTKFSYWRLFFFAGCNMLLCLLCAKSVFSTLSLTHYRGTELFVLEYTVLACTLFFTQARFLVAYYALFHTPNHDFPSKPYLNLFLDISSDFVKTTLLSTFCFYAIFHAFVPLHLIRELLMAAHGTLSGTVRLLQYVKAKRALTSALADCTPEELWEIDTSRPESATNPENVPASSSSSTAATAPASGDQAAAGPTTTTNTTSQTPDGAPGPQYTRVCCAICRGELTEAKKLPCGHKFHYECVIGWMERDTRCPTCRADVNKPPPASAAAAASGGARGARGAVGVGAGRAGRRASEDRDREIPEPQPIPGVENLPHRLRRRSRAQPATATSTPTPASTSTSTSIPASASTYIPTSTLPASNPLAAATGTTAGTGMSAGHTSSTAPLPSQSSSQAIPPHPFAFSRPTSTSTSATTSTSSTSLDNLSSLSDEELLARCTALALTQPAAFRQGYLHAAQEVAVEELRKDVTEGMRSDTVRSQPTSSSVSSSSSSSSAPQSQSLSQAAAPLSPAELQQRLAAPITSLAHTFAGIAPAAAALAAAAEHAAATPAVAPVSTGTPVPAGDSVSAAPATPAVAIDGGRGSAAASTGTRTDMRGGESFLDAVERLLTADAFPKHTPAPASALASHYASALPSAAYSSTDTSAATAAVLPSLATTAHALPVPLQQQLHPAHAAILASRPPSYSTMASLMAQTLPPHTSSRTVSLRAHLHMHTTLLQHHMEVLAERRERALQEVLAAEREMESVAALYNSVLELQVVVGVKGGNRREEVKDVKEERREVEKGAKNGLEANAVKVDSVTVMSPTITTATAAPTIDATTTATTIAVVPAAAAASGVPVAAAAGTADSDGAGVVCDATGGVVDVDGMDNVVVSSAASGAEVAGTAPTAVPDTAAAAPGAVDAVDSNMGTATGTAVDVGKDAGAGANGEQRKPEETLGTSLAATEEIDRTAMGGGTTGGRGGDGGSGVRGDKDNQAKAHDEVLAKDSEIVMTTDTSPSPAVSSSPSTAPSPLPPCPPPFPSSPAVEPLSTTTSHPPSPASASSPRSPVSPLQSVLLATAARRARVREASQASPAPASSYSASPCSLSSSPTSTTPADAESTDVARGGLPEEGV